MPKKYLTDKAVKVQKPHKDRCTGELKRTEIADAGMPGLYLIVQPSGAKSWATRYRHAGRTRKATLGSCPPIDLKEARQRAKDALDALDVGRDPGAERIASKRRQHAPGLDPDAFGVQARAYLTRHAVPHLRTWKEIARNLGLKQDAENVSAFLDIPGGLAERWAALPVQNISRRMIIEAIDEAVDRGAPIGANRQLGILQRLFNWLVARDVLKVAPTVGVRKPGMERSRARVLTDEEIGALWRATAELGFPFGHLVRLLLLTAQRRNEVAAAPWSEFNHNARMWELPPPRTKNKREHLVPLSDAVLGVLAEIPRFEGPFIFGVAGRGPFKGFGRAKRRLDALAGIAPWTLHDLRRTAVTRMADIGVAPHVVEAIINHVSGSKSGVAGVYNRSLYESEKREALGRWARHVERLVQRDDETNVVEMKRGR